MIEKEVRMATGGFELRTFGSTILLLNHLSHLGIVVCTAMHLSREFSEGKNI